MAITKPPVVPAWADTATPTTDIVQPSDPEISAGWPLSTTPPSRQRFNWVLNFCANAVRYFSRRGVPDWDSAETYSTNDIVQQGGALFRSLQDGNTNHLPSDLVNDAWWGLPQFRTANTDDQSSQGATTAYVLGQISISNPLMDGAVAVGTSKKFARADHRHPTDTTRAATSGSYPSMSVGYASSAGSVSWSGVTGKPTTTGGYGITDAITTATIGSQSVAFATTAGRARPRRSDDAYWDLYWSGQGGQPNWLVGSNDGVSFYVYNPANFSVNHATSADTATRARNFPSKAGNNVTLSAGSGPPNLSGSTDGDAWEYY